MIKIRSAIFYLLIIGLFIAGAISCEKRAPGRIIGKKCVECHQKEAAQFKKAKVVHGPVGKNECESCHRPHGVIGAVYLKTAENKLCYNCHKKSKDFANRKHKHDPVKDEKCISCHNPHSSANKNLLKAKGNDLCFDCHNKDAFDRKTKHVPLSDKGCLECHDVHGSDYERLLFDSTADVCSKCHDFKKPGFVKGHSGYQPEGDSCVSCHTPHSSSNTKLLREFAHRPLDRNQCNSCHNPPESKRPLDVKKKRSKPVLWVPHGKSDGIYKGPYPCPGQKRQLPVMPQPPCHG